MLIKIVLTNNFMVKLLLTVFVAGNERYDLLSLRAQELYKSRRKENRNKTTHTILLKRLFTKKKTINLFKKRKIIEKIRPIQ